VIVIERDPCYPWALKRLGVEYFYETFGEGDRIERLFRKLKKRAKKEHRREEIETTIAPLHNKLKQN